MAPEAILYGVTRTIIERLGSSTLQQIGSIWGVKAEFEKMTNTVSTIQAVLQDAEEQQVNNRQVRDWLMKLRDAVFDADDLLSNFSTHVLRQRVMGADKMPKKVCIFFSSSNQLAFGLKMARKMKAMRERLNDIANDRNNFQLVGRSLETPVVIRGRDQTHSYVPEEEVIGREKDKEAIIDLLLDFDLEENVSFISIVGIGGLGKTTLAQYVYNDEKVKTYFELKMWVCVSDVFDVKTIAEKIIGSATGTKPENLEMDQLQIELRKNLDQQKYLLVLDDLWNEDIESWHNLKIFLTVGSKGSKVVITTRTKLVAEITSTVSYLLKGLSKNQSWSLLKQMAFKKGQDTIDTNLEAIGMDIVEKCQGVPLAIKTIGRVLYFKKTEGKLTSLQTLTLFAVSKEDPTASSKHCGGLAELNKLDLRGKLKITNLAWVKDATSETKAANLKEKKHLTNLALRWNPRDDDDLDACEDEISLNGLQPHQSLKRFTRDITDEISASLASSSTTFFPSLESLSLFDCPNLKGWWKRDIVDNSDNAESLSMPEEWVQNLTLVEELVISDCPTLTSLSRFMQHLTSLKTLTILDCEKVDLFSDVDDDGSESQHPTSTCLHSLSFYNISKLEALPAYLQHVTTLQYLQISNCPSFMTLPEWLANLTSLQILIIEECPNLTSLPEGMRHLSSLQSLIIIRCPHLEQRCQKENGEDWHKIAHVPKYTNSWN
uniref:Rx N-terminal domain-containing protein n=1 Tax=Fagus sylvatica TaxID=28930 RepID=A0A2N9FTM3_FAGSY